MRTESLTLDDFYVLRGNVIDKVHIKNCSVFYKTESGLLFCITENVEEQYPTSNIKHSTNKNWDFIPLKELGITEVCVSEFKIYSICLQFNYSLESRDVKGRRIYTVEIPVDRLMKFEEFQYLS